MVVGVVLATIAATQLSIWKRPEVEDGDSAPFYYGGLSRASKLNGMTVSIIRSIPVMEPLYGYEQVSSHRSCFSRVAIGTDQVDPSTHSKAQRPFAYEQQRRSAQSLAFGGILQAFHGNGGV